MMEFFLRLMIMESGGKAMMFLPFVYAVFNENMLIIAIKGIIIISKTMPHFISIEANKDDNSYFGTLEQKNSLSCCDL